ncbi:MAG: hypothetical protein ACJA04_000217 [Cellvibrionaceae bacterium]|jgi:hypothetical protein
MSHQNQAIKRNRFYGFLVLSVVLLPMIAAYLIFTTGWGMPSSTTNKGILLSPPVPIQMLTLNENSGALQDVYPEPTKKWRILVPVRQACDRECQHFLYVSRQVHIRLAEKAYRVERILLLLDEFNTESLESLKKQHPATLIFHANITHLENWLAETQLPEAANDYFYLIDQEGFAMMRYSTVHSGQDLLDDLKKLLKFTYDK